MQYMGLSQNLEVRSAFLILLHNVDWYYIRIQYQQMLEKIYT